MSICRDLSSVQFTPSTYRVVGEHEGPFKRDRLPVFSADGHRDQFRHGQGCALFDVVSPALPVQIAVPPVPPNALKDGFGSCVVTRDMAKPCEFRETSPFRQNQCSLPLALLRLLYLSIARLGDPNVTKLIQKVLNSIFTDKRTAQLPMSLTSSVLKHCCLAFRLLSDIITDLWTWSIIKSPYPRFTCGDNALEAFGAAVATRAHLFTASHGTKETASTEGE